MEPPFCLETLLYMRSFSLGLFLLLTPALLRVMYPGIIKTSDFGEQYLLPRTLNPRGSMHPIIRYMGFG